MQIKISATPTKTELIAKDGAITSGSLNATECIFDLSDEYDELTVCAVFNDVAVPLVDKRCKIPLIDKGKLTVGLYAYASENGKTILRYSPTPIVLTAINGSYSENVIQSEPPDTSEIERFYQTIKQAIAAGKLKGDKGEKGDVGAKGDKGDKGERGEQGLKGDKGDDYALTDSDKQEIADIVMTEYTDELEKMIDDSEVLK